MDKKVKSRKPADSPKQHDDDDDKKRAAGKKTSTLFVVAAAIGYVLLVLTLAAIIAMSVSYVVTDTLTFGYKVNLRKYLPRQERTFTPEELAQYDGSDPKKPIYIALLGEVFDVTAGPSYYGPGGGYHFFAGRDASRAFVTGCFQTHLTHDVRGFTVGQIKSLEEWTEFYKTSDKYFYVGKVLNPPIDPDSPIPPPCE